MSNAVASEVFVEGKALPIERPFLTAAWRDLAMLNYEVDPSLLQRYVPPGTELDDYQGSTFVSIVGFMFHDAKLLGWAAPFHQSFPEVNLRFYVRRLTPAGWRRGVVFLRELAPRRIVAWIARAVYGENYAYAPLRRQSTPAAVGSSANRTTYAGRFASREFRVIVDAEEGPTPLVDGSLNEFIAEHYWGYTFRRNGRTAEYRVAHRPWKAAPATSACFDADVASLYGPQFVDVLSGPPASAFLADGSSVEVFRGRWI
jgi:uncharacterized protein YqjF (DUF2071 family)